MLTEDGNGTFLAYPQKSYNAPFYQSLPVNAFVDVVCIQELFLDRMGGFYPNQVKIIWSKTDSFEEE